MSASSHNEPERIKLEFAAGWSVAGGTTADGFALVPVVCVGGVAIGGEVGVGAGVRTGVSVVCGVDAPTATDGTGLPPVGGLSCDRECFWQKQQPSDLKATFIFVECCLCFWLEPVPDGCAAFEVDLISDGGR